MAFSHFITPLGKMVQYAHLLSNLNVMELYETVNYKNSHDIRASARYFTRLRSGIDF